MKDDVDRPDGRFQPAKNAGQRSRFLQIVAKPDRVTRRKSKEPELTRVAFRVSRLMEFCTRRELQNQTGHSAEDWPLVVLKELMDNSLDACEEVEVAPVIEIKKAESAFKSTTIKAPADLKKQVSAILKKHPDLRWDDAIQIVLDKTQLDHVRAEKQKAKKKSGDFTDADEGDSEEGV